jgi:hypothetical protein
MGKAYLESPKSIGIWQDEQQGEEQGECGGQAEPFGATITHHRMPPNTSLTKWLIVHDKARALGTPWEISEQ